MRFLAGVAKVEAPNEQPEWVKWSCALTWLPKAASCDPVTTQPRTYSVAMIVFAPPREVFRSLGEFIKSPKWTDATVDPYVLADIVLLSWYHHVDQLAWGVTKLVRNEEKDVFEGTRCLLSDESSVQDIDLHRLHTSAKNSLFMLEALDAAVRVAEAAISAHEPLRQHGRIVPENTHRRLRHRLELFHSTRLRMLSCQARIKNTVDLVRLFAFFFLFIFVPTYSVLVFLAFIREPLVRSLVLTISGSGGKGMMDKGKRGNRVIGSEEIVGPT